MYLYLLFIVVNKFKLRSPHVCMWTLRDFKRQSNCYEFDLLFFKYTLFLKWIHKLFGWTKKKIHNFFEKVICLHHIKVKDVREK